MKTSYFTFLIFGYLFVGCSGINTVSNQNGYNSTKIGDIFLNDQIKVVDIKTLDSDNGRTFIVSLKNLMWFDMNIETKMDFYNDDGILLDNPWGWKPLTIEREQISQIKYIAPQKNITKFKLLMQKAGS